MDKKNEGKNLSQVFKELEQVKNAQVTKTIEKTKAKEEKSYLYHLKTRSLKDNIILIIVVLITVIGTFVFASNYLFGTDETTIQTTKVVGVFEENNAPSDVYTIIADNMSTSSQKAIFDNLEIIEFNTEIIENKDKPEGEELVLQEGIPGSKTVTYVRDYENGEIISQNSIGEIINTEPQTRIVEVGTSNLLKQYNIHIGDYLYTADNVELKKYTNDESESWLIVPQYYDVKALEVIDERWLKVSYNSQATGYILCNYLTSETLTPEIRTLCKNAKILNRVNIDMALSEPSGLNENDFKKVLSNHEQDVNHIFEDNYKAFYDAEVKYGINGVFLASIGIHESAWGTSRIAIDKKNLFGFGAYDASPYESALTFETYAKGVDAVAAWLMMNYLLPQGSRMKNGEIASGNYFNGPTVNGVNVRYATDPEWGAKVFNTMVLIYSEL